MKRTSMKRRKSERLQDYDKEFEKMKPLVRERSHGYCEVMYVAQFFFYLDDRDGYLLVADLQNWHAEHCPGYAEHCHHRKYRVRGGSNALSNLVDLSRPCHDWVHAHGGFGQPANLLGLALSAGESEELT